MMKIPENLLRYMIVHTRRKGRLAFSSRDALSLILIAGLPFVMVSSISINKAIHKNNAYAYASTSPSAAASYDMDRTGRQVAAQVKGNPDTLLHINGPQVTMIFDRPGLMRAEGDMSIWQYRTVSCVLDVYVADKGAGPVVHYEARSRVKASGAPAPEAFDDSQSRECVKSVFSGHDGVKPMIFASR